MRPEGVLASLLASLALFRYADVAASQGSGRRPWALAALAGPLLPPALNLAFSGEARTTTQIVKWLPENPYQTGAALSDTVLENLALLFGTLLDGKIWSAQFLPEHSLWVLAGALPATIALGVLRSQTWRAVCLACVGLGLLIPTTYDSFLWNRLRYLWPFFTPWLFGVFAEIELLRLGLARFLPRARALVWVLWGAWVAALLTPAPGSVKDVAESAHDIGAQQVSLGRWARWALPQDARIGVNDAGAVTYFSERRTFDIVGLTTRGEGKYWVAGAGSRFEHYERLPRAALPTHFVVYPEWLGIPPLLGPELTRREVPGATVLGGTLMVARIADYEALGSAELPVEALGFSIVDRLDVADLESEGEHDYHLGEATALDNRVVERPGSPHVDGARHTRRHELFSLAFEPGGRLIARLGAEERGAVRLLIDGADAGTWKLEALPWQEFELELAGLGPTDAARAPETEGPRSRRVELRSETPFSALHYFSVR